MDRPFDKLRAGWKRGGGMKKRFGIVFPSEAFATLEEATEYAARMVTEEGITAGVYVVEAAQMLHFKCEKKAKVKRCKLQGGVEA